MIPSHCSDTPMGDLSGGGPVSCKVSFVVPCFNEAEVIAELHRRASSAARAAVGEDYEIVYVDDGSKDNTWDQVKELSGTDSHVVAVKLSRNHGHQLALTAGLSVAQGEEIFVIDADLQDPPELLREMRALMQETNADVVFGQRKRRKGESAFKLASAHLFYRWLRQVSSVDIPLDAGDFRLMRRHVSDLLVQMPERDRFIRGMVAWLGFKQVPFRYDRDRRFAGTTKYPLSKMIRFAMDALYSFSMAPVRIAGALATMSMVVAIGAMLYAFVSWLYLDVQPGWASIVAVVAFFSGCQLAVLSIFGELIGRIYIEQKRRPLFVIEQVQRDQVAHNRRQLTALG